MRHKKDNRRLSRPSAHREALLTNLLQSLVKHGRIVTTVARAKELKRLADRLVTIAKRRSHSAYVQLSRYIKAERETLIPKLMEEIAPKFANRKGGYTRIIKLGFRRGDAAPTAIIEYLSEVLTGKQSESVADEKEEKVAKENKSSSAKSSSKKPSRAEEAVEGKGGSGGVKGKKTGTGQKKETSTKTKKEKSKEN